MSRIASYFNKADRKKLFFDYLKLIGILEIVIFIVVALWSADDKYHRVYTPFPWKEYLFVAFAFPICFTFLMGVIITGFNHFLGEEKTEKSEGDPENQLDAVVRQVRRLPLLAILFLLLVTLPTKVHERYILLVLPFLSMAAMLRSQLRRSLTAQTFSALIQLSWPAWAPWSRADPLRPLEWPALAPALVAAALTLVQALLAGNLGMLQFVVVSEARARDRALYDEAIAALCPPAATCFLRFFTNPTGAPLSMPLPDVVLAEPAATYQRSAKQANELFQWSCRLGMPGGNCF